MPLGEFIALARELKGWSQRELAKRSGVNYGVIAQMETGHIKEPSFRNMIKIANALGLPLQRLADHA